MLIERLSRLWHSHCAMDGLAPSRTLHVTPPKSFFFHTVGSLTSCFPSDLWTVLVQDFFFVCVCSHVSLGSGSDLEVLPLDESPAAPQGSLTKGGRPRKILYNPGRDPRKGLQETPAKASERRPHPGRNYIRLPPPSPPISAQKVFLKGRGGGVYFQPPRGRNFIRPSPFYTPPRPRRIFVGVGGGGCV